MKKIQRNRLGFSLVEVMLVVGLVTIIALGFSKLMMGGLKGQRTVQDAADLNTFGNALQQVMSVNSSCDANLALGTTPVQFDTAGPYPSPLQTTIPGTINPIISEIDYPMPKPGSSPVTYIPNPNSPLIKTGGSWGGWIVNQIGIVVKGSPGPNQYYITLEVEFKKKLDSNGVPLSLGSSTGLRQTTALSVTTTPVAGTTTAKVTGCGGAASGMTTIPKSQLPAIFAGKWTVGTWATPNSGSYKIDTSMHILQCTGSGGTGTCTDTGLSLENGGLYATQCRGGFFMITLTGLLNQCFGNWTYSQFVPWGN